MKYAPYDPGLKDRMVASVYDDWLETLDDNSVRVVEAHKATLMKACSIMGPTMAKALLVRLYLFVGPRIPDCEVIGRQNVRT